VNSLLNRPHRRAHKSCKRLQREFFLFKRCRIYSTGASLLLCNIQYYIEDSRACHELIKVDSVSDLGVIFDFKLCFSDHVNEKISKACIGLQCPRCYKRNIIYMDKILLLYYIGLRQRSGRI